MRKLSVGLILQINWCVCSSISRFQASKQKREPVLSSLPLDVFCVLRFLGSEQLAVAQFLTRHNYCCHPRFDFQFCWCNDSSQKSKANEHIRAEVGETIFRAIIPMFLNAVSGLLVKKWHWCTWVHSNLLLVLFFSPKSQNFVLNFKVKFVTVLYNKVLF